MIFFLSGCCCSYDEQDFEFNESDLKHFNSFEPGDTIYYESNNHDIDTILIYDYRTEQHKDCCGINTPKPVNSKSVRIRHLPFDSWKSVTINGNTRDTTSINYQELFGIFKFPTDKKTEYTFNFKNFYTSWDTTIGEYHSDTINLNNKKITDYYLIKHYYPEEVKDPDDIEFLFWSDKGGLLAYKNKGGELWTKQNHR